jgi:hypothetical protein
VVGEMKRSILANGRDKFKDVLCSHFDLESVLWIEIVIEFEEKLKKAY